MEKGREKGREAGKTEKRNEFYTIYYNYYAYTNNGQKKQSRQLHTKHDNVHRNNALVHLLHESKTQLINNKK